MKLFIIGLIAGTAFAEPNLRPTDRKLGGDETTTVTWPVGSSFNGEYHTLTITGETAPFPDLNTANGVKVLALAFKTQEEGKLTQCATDFETWSGELEAYKAYNWAIAKKAFVDYKTAKNLYELCQEWSAYNSCTIGQAAEAELTSQTASSRRRLDITVGHLDAALNYLGSGMTTCEQPNVAVSLADCTASAPSTVNDPGVWDTDNGNEPDYTGTLAEVSGPGAAPTGCGSVCADAPTDPQNPCSIRNPCIVEKVCGIKRVILVLDPNHTF